MNFSCAGWNDGNGGSGWSGLRDGGDGGDLRDGGDGGDLRDGGDGGDLRDGIGMELEKKVKDCMLCGEVMKGGEQIVSMLRSESGVNKQFPSIARQ